MAIPKHHGSLNKPVQTTREDRIALLNVLLKDSDKNFPPSTPLRPLRERRPDLYPNQAE